VDDPFGPVDTSNGADVNVFVRRPCDVLDGIPNEVSEHVLQFFSLTGDGRKIPDVESDAFAPDFGLKLLLELVRHLVQCHVTERLSLADRVCHGEKAIQHLEGSIDGDATHPEVFFDVGIGRRGTLREQKYARDGHDRTAKIMR